MLKRPDYQATLEQFNRRMGRASALSGATAASPSGGGMGGGGGGILPAPRASPSQGFSMPQMPNMNMARLNSSGSASQVGAKASAAAQNVAAAAARLNPNLTAAKASAAAAGESMRDSMSTAMRAMKSKSLRSLGFGFQRDGSS